MNKVSVIVPLARTNRHQAPQTKVRVRIAAIVPAVLAIALYLVNNLGVLHALFNAPDGYVPMGISRDPDVAQYITWIRGLAQQWTIPNYYAAWRTESGMAVPMMTALAKLCSWSGLSAVAVLQVFQLLAYLLTAYAGTFALHTFCDNRRQKLTALVGAIACLPVQTLLWLPMLRDRDWQLVGAGEFVAANDGFFRGIINWPMLTFGAFTVVLAVPLTAHYLLTRQRRWLWLLAGDCFLSAFFHPFEIIPIAVAVTVLFLRCRSGQWRRVAADIGTIAAASAAGMAIYVAQTLRHSWIQEASLLNTIYSPPAIILPALGTPVLIGIFFLLLGIPHRSDIKATVLKVWFVVTLLVAYAPKVPFPLHVFDGFYFVVGLLVMYQVRDVVGSWRLPPHLVRPVLALGACILVIMIAPHFILRRVAWSDGIRTTRLTFPSAIARRDEASMIEWFRRNSSSDSLVLAPPDQAPWIATVPIHSFGGHWLFSMQTVEERETWTAFYSGQLMPRDAWAFLAKYGFSFAVIPSKSPAIQYVRDDAQLAARFGDFEVFKLPNDGMRERAAIHGSLRLLNNVLR